MNNQINVPLPEQRNDRGELPNDLQAALGRMTEEQREELRERLLWSNIAQMRMEKYALTQQGVDHMLGWKTGTTNRVVRCVIHLSDDQVNQLYNLYPTTAKAGIN